MAVIETWVKTDLQSIVKVKMMHGILFSQDNMANLIGVELLDGGAPATVSGSVSANVLRADGTTVAVAGTLSGNLASVTLPQAAYAVPGTVAIAIKLTTDGTITTIGAIQSIVYRTSSDTIIDPGTIIPSVQDLIAAINAAVNSIPADYSALTDIVKDGNYTGLSHAFDGKYIKNDNTEATNGMLSHTDYIRIPANTVKVMLGNKTSGAQSSTSYTISPNVLFYDENKNFLSYVNVSGQDIAVVDIPANAVFLRANQPSSVAINADRLIQFVYKDIDEVVDKKADWLANNDLAFLVTAEGSYVDGTGEHDSSMLAHTDFIAVPDWATQIIATSKAYTSSGANVYRIAPTVVWYDEAKTYIETGNTYVVKDTQNFPVPTGAKYCKVNQPLFETLNKRFIQFTSSPIVAYVGSGLDKTELSSPSFTEMLLLLKNVSKPKTIIVSGGDYDIFQEYTALGLLSGNPPSNPTTGYFNYNVMIPPNTHVVGNGIVRLLWQPTAEQISIPWSQTISPVNCAGSMILENVEIHCKNGRYCIHDDTLGKPEYFGATKQYKNVKCYKYANDEGYGFGSVIGFGLDARCRYEFDECYFTGPNGNVFYAHDRRKDQNGNDYGVINSPSVCAKNCIMDAGGRTRIAIKLGNTVASGSPVLDIKVLFDGCYVRGWLDLRDESSTTGDNGNSFDVTMLNCTKTQISDRYGESNPHPVKVYNEIGDIAE